MANYATLLATIAANIYTNGNNEVTAAMVKSACDQMVASLGAGYQFMGVATPSTNPGTPDQRAFYIAAPGIYPNFNANIETGAIGIFKYDSSWSVESIPVNIRTETITLQTSISGKYVNQYGALGEFSGGRISAPVYIKAGFKITFDARGNEAVAFISKTNASGSTYTPAVVGTGPSTGASDQTATYEVQQSGYFAFSSLAALGDITLEQFENIFDEIDNIETEIGLTETETKTLSVQRSGSYINAGGSIWSFSGGRVSFPIWLDAGTKLTYTASANENVSMISKTDASGNNYDPVVIGVGPTSGSTLQDAVYEVQQSGYFAFSSLGGGLGTLIAEVYVSGIWRAIYDLSDQLASIETQDAFGSQNILAAFDNIVCIGDSLTYSQVYTGASTTRQARRTYPAILGSLCDNTAQLLATPGATAKSCWYEYGDDIVAKTNAVAIVYLGTNAGLTNTVDTDAAGDDPTQWTDNNTGCYCRIVQKLKSLGYKVMLLRCWATSGSGSSDLDNTNAAITSIGYRFNCAVMDVPVNKDYQYHYYPDLSGRNNVHYNDLGYAWFASQLLNAICKLPTDQMKYLIPS